MRIAALVAAAALAACGGKSQPAADPAVATEPASDDGAAIGNTAPADEPMRDDDGWGTSPAAHACRGYVQAVELFLLCDKVPQASRDATRQGLEAMKAGWANLDELPPESQQAVVDACRQAADALRQGAAAMGCPT